MTASPFNSMNRRDWLLAASALTAAMPTATLAQGFPNKPLNLVVPFPPGGSTDLAARTIATQLSTALGQPVVIQNRPGAQGAIGAEQVAKSSPDGHTLLLSNFTPLTLMPHLIPDGSTLKSLAPIGSLAYLPQALVTTRFSSVGDMKSRRIAFGHSGNGSLSHLLAVLVARQVGSRADYAPYRGIAPLLLDLQNGQVDTAVLPMGSIVAMSQAGKIKILAATSPTSSAPGIPTFEETGLGGAAFQDWLGLLAPPGVPREVITRLNAALNRIVQMTEVQQRLTSVGAMPQLSSPEQWGTLIRLYSDRMGAVIREEGITANS
jgi:tripartite-type tricarboxylate transporter receptor subunit TctC